LCLAFLLAGACACQARHGTAEESAVRLPAVAGRFYPGDREALRASISAYLARAAEASVGTPIAILSPHAGYAFSGQIAADAFECARGGDYEVVVLLGTNHTVVPFPGMAISPSSAFRTPLGDAAVDDEVRRELLRASSRCVLDAGPHAREHSIEVQIPFVQRLFPKARIVPAVVGSPDVEVCGELGRTLAKVLKDRRALIVASSDLSHYPSYDDASAVDHSVLRAVAALDPEKLRGVVRREEQRRIPNLATCACGEAPILAAMIAAKELGATRGHVVSYASSGDALIGDRDRVVGYGAVAWCSDPGDGEVPTLEVPRDAPEDLTLTAADRNALCAFARECVVSFLRSRTTPMARHLDPRLFAKRAAFVTLKKRGELRGCIGHMATDQPLAQVVGSMALQAAFNDRRFPPVRADELDSIEVEISVLTPAKPVSGPGEIVVGRDGVVLSKDGRSAVFLPQVAPEQGWTRDEMLDQLCRKAGLPAGSWKEGARFSTFQAEVFHEPQSP
jgi:AmmeMemoRadiSam system protein B/AmmeMemoRadiSam system protein A